MVNVGYVESKAIPDSCARRAKAKQAMEKGMEKALKEVKGHGKMLRRLSKGSNFGISMLEQFEPVISRSTVAPIVASDPLDERESELATRERLTALTERVMGKNKCENNGAQHFGIIDDGEFSSVEEAAQEC